MDPGENGKDENKSTNSSEKIGEHKGPTAAVDDDPENDTLPSQNETSDAAEEIDKNELAKEQLMSIGSQQEEASRTMLNNMQTAGMNQATSSENQPQQLSQLPKRLKEQRTMARSDKYERLCKIGEGSYGVVFKSRNRENGQIVAIKKFVETDDDPAIRKIAMREIRMLRQLKHPNLVNLIEVFKRNRKIHLVFEHYDLEKHPEGCPELLTKKVIYQLINAIRFCHSRNCLHRDVKPENILLTTQDVVKLADFGFARISKLLTGDRYGTQVDIWAIGCVFAEMLTGEPLWPGKSDLDQIYLIRRTLGEITQHQLHCLNQLDLYRGVEIPEPEEHSDLRQRLFQSGNPEVASNDSIINFLARCLDPNPSIRWTADQLLHHEYFFGFSFKLPNSEITMPSKKPPPLTLPSYLPYLDSNQQIKIRNRLEKLSLDPNGATPAADRENQATLGSNKVTSLYLPMI